MSVGRPRNKPAAEQTLRETLGCATTERTIDCARRVVAENALLRRKVADLEAALAVAWARNEEREAS